MRPLDLHGQTFGKLRVEGVSDRKRSGGGRLWRLTCECGRECHIPASILVKKIRACFNCAKKKDLPLGVIRNARRSGTSVQHLANRFGVNRDTISRHIGRDGRRPNWMWRNYRRVKDARGRGESWGSITAWSPYALASTTASAYSRERRRRIKEQNRFRVQVQIRTQQGMSLEAIAAELNTSDRQVSRARAKNVADPVPALDMHRIRKLLLRGVDWVQIWSRVGKPMEDHQIFWAWFELIDEEERLQ